MANKYHNSQVQSLPPGKGRSAKSSLQLGSVGHEGSSRKLVKGSGDNGTQKMRVGIQRNGMGYYNATGEMNGLGAYDRSGPGHPTAKGTRVSAKMQDHEAGWPKPAGTQPNDRNSVGFPVIKTRVTKHGLH